MDKLRAESLQRQITREALAGVSLAGANADIARYEQTIRLIGTTWELPSENTDTLLNLIQQEKAVVQKLEVGEKIDHVTLDDRDSLCNWSGMETFEAVEDLFETAVRLNSYTERQTMLNMAKSLVECQNFLDWIEKTPAEQELSPIMTA